jgi:hypothetical protein
MKLPAPFVFALGFVAGPLALAAAVSLPGCGALAELGGLQLCVSTPGHAAASSSAPAVAELAMSSSAGLALAPILPSAVLPAAPPAPTVAPASSGVLRHAQ